MAALAAFLFFAWLAAEVVRGRTLGFDMAVRTAVHSWSSPLLTQALRGATRLGESWVLIPLGLLLAWILVRRGNRSAATALAAATVGGEIINAILKAIFHRQRPDAFFGFAQPLYYSFPSGHALVSTCFYGGLAAILASGSRRKTAYWIFGASLPLVIGFSRIYLGVHYPTDVLAGYAAGIVWLSIIFRFYRFSGTADGTRTQAIG